MGWGDVCWQLCFQSPLISRYPCCWDAGGDFLPVLEAISSPVGSGSYPNRPSVTGSILGMGSWHQTGEGVAEKAPLVRSQRGGGSRHFYGQGDQWPAHLLGGHAPARIHLRICRSSFPWWVSQIRVGACSIPGRRKGQRGSSGKAEWLTPL